jgi:hypothetical protein
MQRLQGGGVERKGEYYHLLRLSWKEAIDIKYLLLSSAFLSEQHNAAEWRLWRDKLKD